MVDLVHDPSCTHSVLLSYCMLKDVKKGINKGGLCDSVWRFTNSVRPPPYNTQTGHSRPQQMTVKKTYGRESMAVMG